jgi:hypothetical protein
MVVLSTLPANDALHEWNDLAFNNTDRLTIAHHPFLYYFFTDYLKLPAYYCLIYQDNVLIGLLPLVKTGKKYISTPHFTYGGVLWKENIPETIDEALFIEKLIREIHNRKLASGFYRFEYGSEIGSKESSHIPIEVRTTRGLFKDKHATKVVHLIPLGTTIDDLKNTFDPNLKRKVNKSIKNDLKVKSGKHELINDFVRVYNRNMHRIGSPTLGEKFFNALISAPGMDTKVFVAYKERIPVGGSLVMWYDGYYENLWFSTLKEYNRLYTSYALHYAMIKHATETDARIYSMGRSTIGSGTDIYKSQWPATRKEIFFNRNYTSSASLKDQKWMTGVWKRLPAALVDKIGPMVAKKIY